MNNKKPFEVSGGPDAWTCREVATGEQVGRDRTPPPDQQ